MPSTVTPNMGLTLPTPGQEQGPDYAVEINNDLSLIDTHNHSPGQGEPVTPSGINISSDLTFLSNNAVALRSIRFTTQGSPLSLGTDIGCLYENGVDLYYNDGNGNQIRMTQGGSIAGTSGSITNLVSPASVVYNSGTATYTFESDTSIAGNLDGGSITLRNISPNSTFGTTIAPASALVSNYTITLPGSAPGSISIMRMDSSGNVSANLVVDNSTIVTTSNTLQVPSQGITATQIANATITATQLSSNIDLPGTTATVGSQKIISQNANTSTSMCITRGYINSSGGGAGGEGYTSVRNSTGVYTVTFANPYKSGDTPIVNLTVLNSSAAYWISLSAIPTNTGFTVRIEDGSTNPFNSAFTFIAIGLRSS